MHLKKHPNETTIFMDISCSKAKKVIAYAQSRNNKINIMDWKKEKLTTTHWKEILVKLNKKPKDLLDKSKSYYRENLKGRDFNEEDWLNILVNSPELLKGPIIMEGDKAMLCENPTSVISF